MSAPVSPPFGNDGSGGSGGREGNVTLPAREPAHTAERAGGVPSASSSAHRGSPGLWARDAALGLLIALVVVLLFVFSGSEDRGFIYVDF